MSRGCEDEEAAPLPPVLSDAAGRAAVVLGSGLAGVTGPAILGAGSGTRDPPLSRAAVLGGGGVVCASPSAAACLDGDFALFATWDDSVRAVTGLVISVASCKGEPAVLL